MRSSLAVFPRRSRARRVGRWGPTVALFCGDTPHSTNSAGDTPHPDNCCGDTLHPEPKNKFCGDTPHPTMMTSRAAAVAASAGADHFVLVLKKIQGSVW